MEKNDDILSLDDKRKLNLTASIRETIIEELTKDGKIPEDKDSQSFLIKALDGLDNNTLKQARLKVDKDKNNNDETTSNLITEFLLRFNGTPTTQKTNNSESNELDNSFVIQDKVPGETDIGTKVLTIEEIKQNLDY